MRTRAVTLSLALACALLAAACGTSSSSSSSAAAASSSTTATGGAGSSTTTAQIGFEAVPLEQGPELAPAGTTQTGKVDGISCGPSEQLVYHIHAHLAVFDNGRMYALPAGIGIPGSTAEPTTRGPEAAGGQCIYWLHTHSTDGIIHIESPLRAIYTLGTFFDEWHQPLTPTRAGALSGKITAFVNGKRWNKTPRAIPLLPHEDIQLDIGAPTPPLIRINWAKTQL